MESRLFYFASRHTSTFEILILSLSRVLHAGLQVLVTSNSVDTGQGGASLTLSRLEAALTLPPSPFLTGEINNFDDRGFFGALQLDIRYRTHTSSSSNPF